MGKGDKKTKRGKIILGTYGNKRRKKKDRKYIAPPGKAKKETNKNNIGVSL